MEWFHHSNGKTMGKSYNLPKPARYVLRFPHGFPWSNLLVLIVPSLECFTHFEVGLAIIFLRQRFFTF